MDCTIVILGNPADKLEVTVSLGIMIPVVVAIFAGGILLFAMTRRSREETIAVSGSDQLRTLSKGASLIFREQQFVIEHTLFLDEGATTLHRLQAANGSSCWLHIDPESDVEFWFAVHYEGVKPQIGNTPMELAFKNQDQQDKIFVHANEGNSIYTSSGSNTGGYLEKIEYTERHNPRELLIFVRLNDDDATAYHGMKISPQDLSI